MGWVSDEDERVCRYFKLYLRKKRNQKKEGTYRIIS